MRKRKPKKKSEPGSTAYLRWIRSLPCAICDGRLGKSEAAHTEVYGHSGMGQKATYRSCIPLCAWDHTLLWNSYHELPEQEWSGLHGIDVVELVRTLNSSYDDWRNRKKAAASQPDSAEKVA